MEKIHSPQPKISTLLKYLERKKLDSLGFFCMPCLSGFDT
ncbi:hypothetical protein C427_0559 [Paraglaciecola psychrophila 170]|uniref:Uncharacterized protein n=1 Tax=Paraglaciecola psychrophila 170 TaxID=1129794 RepID=M4RKI5_9ALTE|nr:hypothetical protein C427_0559 [Paraglaciecola psychrophila 170]